MPGWQQQCEHTPPSIPFSCARAGHSSPLQWPVSTLSFSLSFCLCCKQTQTYSLFVPMQLLHQLFPSFLTCHIHFFISSLQAIPSFILPSFLPSFFLLLPLQQPLHLHRSLPQLLSHLGLFAWQSVKDVDSVSRASRALLRPSRPGLRFVMLDNTLQCGDKTSGRRRQKGPCFFLPSPPLIALLAWRRRILWAISFRERNEDCREEKNSSAEFDILSWYRVYFVYGQLSI